MISTPICDFVNRYSKGGALRAHMPGHKGVGSLGIEALDITEINGADVLYGAEGIISESQRNASEIFGSGRTLYSTEGSTLCIWAMVYLASVYAKEVGREPRILAARNAHRSFMNAAAIVGVEVEWLFSESSDSLISCKISSEELEEIFRDRDEMPTAVYITSPDYLGNIQDIEKISEVCHRYGVLLMVDNAHGAYLGFLQGSRHPLALGADVCCDSAHKTLPVLTGGAYLHISKSAPGLFFDVAQNAMSIFASTSPSYLILQSLDMANLYLSDSYIERLAEFTARVRELKNTLEDNGFSLMGDEDIKITILSKGLGYMGYELAEYLEGQGIVCEFSDPDHTVMMLTPEIDGAGLEAIKNALLRLERKEPITQRPPIPVRAVRAMSAREAMMSPSEELDSALCIGRVLATATVSCPPAIPIVACGEIIDESAARCFEYYGIKKCRVVLE